MSKDKDKMNFKGKTAIITGGTRGIGKAISNKLYELGSTVIATGTAINDGFRTEENGINYVRLDFLDDHSIGEFTSFIHKIGKIDILINNAGTNIIEPIGALAGNNWEKVIKINLTGPMLLMKEISNVMKNNRWGRILNISSIWGIIGKEKRNSYAASKAGIIGLTRTVALDLAPYGILVNALCPGFTMTGLTFSSLSQEEIIDLSKDIPLGRFADVEEIANAAVFLCSDLNTYITGQAIVADGGFTIK